MPQADYLNQNLSEHFTLYEMCRSNTASRYGIDNAPPEEMIPKLVTLCETILEPIRAGPGRNRPIRPNSVFRSVGLNHKIKGSKTSQHMKAEAADIEVPGVSNYDLAEWVRDNLMFDQLILECFTPGIPHSGWVHVSRALFYDQNRKQVLTYSGGQYHDGLIY
jgi:zinc D-Ala-D-Ala carboxypeptidase